MGSKWALVLCCGAVAITYGAPSKSLIPSDDALVASCHTTRQLADVAVDANSAEGLSTLIHAYWYFRETVGTALSAATLAQLKDDDAHMKNIARWNEAAIESIHQPHGGFFNSGPGLGYGRGFNNVTAPAFTHMTPDGNIVVDPTWSTHLKEMIINARGQ